MHAALRELMNLPPEEGQASAPSKSPLQKLSYNHDAMIDILIAEPWISQDQLAARFGMSASWVSVIIASDLFQARLAERREKIVDPEIRNNIKTMMEGLHRRSIEILLAKLDKPPAEVPDQLALQTAKVMGQSLGIGQTEPRTTVHETHVHLEQLGENLVGLLRRRKESVDGQVLSASDEPSTQLELSPPEL